MATTGRLQRAVSVLVDDGAPAADRRGRVLACMICCIMARCGESVGAICRPRYVVKLTEPVVPANFSAVNASQHRVSHSHASQRCVMGMLLQAP